MALSDWIKTTGDKIRDAVERAFPPLPQPQRAPVPLVAPTDRQIPHTHYDNGKNEGDRSPVPLYGQ
jgi:hypothetical protein